MASKKKATTAKEVERESPYTTISIGLHRMALGGVLQALDQMRGVHAIRLDDLTTTISCGGNPDRDEDED
jgi:hypothetical protein